MSKPGCGLENGSKTQLMTDSFAVALTGVCFSLQGHGASNHATIQSIVHAMGRRAEVPAPSCVPRAMSPLTLLYFDQDNNVVLRNYPNMIAHSCSCQ